MKDIIVVTGAAGFIGSNILSELQATRPERLVAVDWFESGDKWKNVKRRSLSGVIPPEELKLFLSENGTRLRAVIHMGAISSTTECDVDLLVARNINYSLMLWDWCTANEVPFIYASSAATYGGMESGFKDHDDPESLSALQPLNPYGWSKKAVDDIFSMRAAKGDKTPPQWVGLKFFNVYGPNEYHKGDMRSVAVKMFETVQAGKTIQLFKSYRPDFAHGEQRRDFIYVKDCARAVCRLLERPDVSGILNMGSGKAQSFLDVANAVLSAMGKKAPIEFIEMPESLRPRYQYFTQADMSRVLSLGMDMNFHTIEQGILDYYTNYFSKSDPYC